MMQWCEWFFISVQLFTQIRWDVHCCKINKKFKKAQLKYYWKTFAGVVLALGKSTARQNKMVLYSSPTEGICFDTSCSKTKIAARKCKMSWSVVQSFTLYGHEQTSPSTLQEKELFFFFFFAFLFLLQLSSPQHYTRSSIPLSSP